MTTTTTILPYPLTQSQKDKFQDKLISTEINVGKIKIATIFETTCFHFFPHGKDKAKIEETNQIYYRLSDFNFISADNYESAKKDILKLLPKEVHKYVKFKVKKK